MGNSITRQELEQIGGNIEGKNLKKVINVFIILFVILFFYKMI